MTGRDKRRHERTIVQWVVAITKQAGTTFSGTVENLGVLGALVSTPELEPSLTVGDRVELAMHREGQALQVSGEVLRVDQEFLGGDIRRTFAVKFDESIDV